MRLVLEIDLDEKTQRKLLENSLERVINNAIFVGSETEGSNDEHLSDRASTLWQDCEELKPLVLKLWDTAANELRKELYIQRGGLA